MISTEYGKAGNLLTDILPFFSLSQLIMRAFFVQNDSFDQMRNILSYQGKDVNMINILVCIQLKHNSWRRRTKCSAEKHLLLLVHTYWLGKALEDWSLSCWRQFRNEWGRSYRRLKCFEQHACSVETAHMPSSFHKSRLWPHGTDRLTINGLKTDTSLMNAWS